MQPRGCGAAKTHAEVLDMFPSSLDDTFTTAPALWNILLGEEIDLPPCVSFLHMIIIQGHKDACLDR